jgi:hypothetical protein
MHLILDSDGLIKLNRAGVLEVVMKSFACLVPRAVYEEVVIVGSEHKYADAEAIGETLRDRARIPAHTETERAELGLGKGEAAILAQVGQFADAVVVSDDRRFLTVLSVEEIAFLTPADLLVLMAKRGYLTTDDAVRAVERLRPLIRTQAYFDARASLGAEW